MMRPKLCEQCMSPVLVVADRTAETKEYEWLTGRKLPWSDDPEITIIKVYPMKSLNTRFYHSKF